MNSDMLCYGCFSERSNTKNCLFCDYIYETGPESLLHLTPGTVLLNKYLIGKVLGQGGFGITYLAFDINLNLKLAIKEYLPQYWATRTSGLSKVVMLTSSTSDLYKYGLTKYMEEARTLARFLEHPNIVSIRDYFEDNNTAYIVMSYHEGLTLQKYLTVKDEPLSLHQSLTIFLPVLDALKEIHTAGILHRDISPDNLIINKSGQVILIDFGAARQAVSGHRQELSVLLKAGYSPEEQFRKKGEQGPWSDIYALAATIYRTITGQIPPESLDRLLEDNITPPSKMGVDVNYEQEKVLLKALAVRATDRYRTVDEFQKALILSNTNSNKPLLSKQNESITNTDHHNITEGESKVEQDSVAEIDNLPLAIQKADDLPLPASSLDDLNIPEDDLLSIPDPDSDQSEDSSNVAPPIEDESIKPLDDEETYSTDKKDDSKSYDDQSDDYLDKNEIVQDDIILVSKPADEISIKSKVDSKKVTIPTNLREINITQTHKKIIATILAVAATVLIFVFSQYNQAYTLPIPETPIGSTVVLQEEEVLYKIQQIGDSEAVDIEYRLDWGNGNYSDWSNQLNYSYRWTQPGSYEIKVQARCAQNKDQSEWSAPLQVFVEEKIILIPLAPRLLTPAENFVNTSEAATFEWMPVEDADFYVINVTRSSDSQIIIDKNLGNKTTFTTDELPDDGSTYTWAVAAGNPSGLGLWSKEQSFIQGQKTSQEATASGGTSPVQKSDDEDQETSEDIMKELKERRESLVSSFDPGGGGFGGGGIGGGGGGGGDSGPY